MPETPRTSRHDAAAEPERTESWIARNDYAWFLILLALVGFLVLMIWLGTRQNVQA